MYVCFNNMEFITDFLFKVMIHVMKAFSLFIHLSFKYLLNYYYVPGIIFFLNCRIVNLQCCISLKCSAK